MKISTVIVNEINEEFNLNLKTIDSAQMDEFINRIFKEQLGKRLDKLRNIGMINMAVELDIIGNLTK